MNKHLAGKIAVRVLFALAVFAIASFTFVGRASAASPEAQTRSASDVSEDSAQLNGYLYTNGEDTVYWFEYGTSRSNLDYDTSEKEVSDRDGRVTVYNIIRNGLDPDETYYFRIVAENDDGIDRGEILSFQTDGDYGGDYDAPEVDTLSAQVNGSSAVLNGKAYSDGSPQTWFRYGQSRGSLNLNTPTTIIFGSGSMYFSDTIRNLAPGTVYYYQAVAKNSDGTSYGDVLSFTASSGSGGGSSQAPVVSTNSANVTGNNSAILSAQVNPKGNLSSVWFEYGRSASLGSATTRDPAGSGVGYSNYSANLSGLAAGTTYYYRAVAQNSFGVTRGQTATFRTQGSPSAPPVPYTPSNPSNGSSGSGQGSVPPASAECLVVSPSVSNQQLKANDNFTYSVTYRNDCDSAISGASLRVTLPQAIDFAGTNYPFLTRDGNVITYNLGVVARNFQATVTVDGKVRSQVESGDSLIFQSDIDFTDQRGNLRNASGFLSVMIADGGTVTAGTSTLSASAADALGGLFHSGWFWLILFLILAALFVFWLATRRRGDETEEDEDDTDMVHGAH